MSLVHSAVDPGVIVVDAVVVVDFVVVVDAVVVVDVIVDAAGFTEQPEVLELFLTDFQMRLLWGSRGAEESQALRYAKFDQVLTALSVRLEPPGRRRGPRPSC